LRDLEVAGSFPRSNQQVARTGRVTIMAVPDGAVRIIATYDIGDGANTAETVHHLLLGDGDGAVEADPTTPQMKLGAALWAWTWLNSVAKRIADTVDLTQIEVISLQPVPPVGAVFAVANTDGANSNPVEVSAACIISQWKTGVVDRNSNGRTYWPGCASGELTDGRHVASSPYASWVQNSIDFFNGLIDVGLRGALTTDNETTVGGDVYSRDDLTDVTLGLHVGRNRTGELAIPQDWVAVNGVTVNRLGGIQRRRMK
jgi:hypothetical protein